MPVISSYFRMILNDFHPNATSMQVPARQVLSTYSWWLNLLASSSILPRACSRRALLAS